MWINPDVDESKLGPAQRATPPDFRRGLTWAEWRKHRLDAQFAAFALVREKWSPAAVSYGTTKTHLGRKKLDPTAFRY